MDEYIKKESLLSIYKKWLPQLESKEDEGDRRGVETCIAVIEDLPAADVAPVVHSKWDTVFFQRNERELASYTHVCPMCKFLYRNLSFKGYNYCPNCGAHMEDGE